MRSKFIHMLTASVAAVGLSLGAANMARGEVVAVGAGSYQTGNGKAKGDPVRGPNFKGAAPTQTWFSSLLFKGAQSNAMYPHPLAVKPSGNGLAIQYMGPYLSGNAGGFGAEMKTADITLTGTEGNYQNVGLDGYSDWFIDVAFTSGGGKGMHLSYGHGSPFVYATYDSGGAAVNCNKNPEVWSKGGNVLGITVGNASYALFGPTGSTWEVDGSKITNNGGGKNYFSVAALPDNKPETLALFKKYAFNHVTGTKTVWKFEKGNMVVDFNFETKTYEDGDKGTITALLPHQWKYADEKVHPLTKLTYKDGRGEMKVSAGTSFTTATPIQGIMPMLPSAGVENKDRIEGYLRDVPNGGGGGETYGGGKHMGKLASLASIADSIGETATRDRIISQLKGGVENWLTANSGENNTYYVYNSNWGILTGVNGGYGADWPFNDHHFHYGYLIRAAAEVARVDPAWAEKWGPMVNLIIREVASPDRNDKMFPSTRCFDRYEGHGWASGDAGFGRGNNNESSSESMNCWYGIAMWGAAIGDDAMRDYGLYMFTTDMTAIEEYWFDVSATNFPKNYPHPAVGMVWGDGGHWGTWFSGDPDCIQGIQYLPYTPGSVYLIRYPDYIKRAYSSLMETRKAKANLNDGWGDLVVMFGAGENPSRAMEFVNSTPNMKVEAGNSRAFMYQWCSTLNTLGTIDKTVTGDYPCYNVYNKNGKKTYAVYNFSGKPLTVKFSDGKTVEAGKKGMNVSN